MDGFVSAGLQIGLETVLVKPKRGLAVVPQTSSGLTSALFQAQVVIKEEHSDALTITEHPVEFGSNIADHAFKRPAGLVLHYGWSNSPAPSLLSSLSNMAAGVIGGNVAQFAGLAGLVQSSIAGFSTGETADGVSATQVNIVYAYLLALQANKVLFDVYTGKRFYQNMIIESLDVETDVETENSLIAHVHCKQLIIANTSIVSLPASIQANPSATASTIQRGRQQARRLS